MDSLASPVTLAVRPPISCTSSKYPLVPNPPNNVRLHCSRRRAMAAEKRRRVQQQLNAVSQQRAQYVGKHEMTAAYMSMKCHDAGGSRPAVYPYAVSAGAGTLGGLLYDVNDADGDACSWRSNVDNEYAYVDELLPAPPPLPPASTSSLHRSPPAHDHTANNNNAAYHPRATQQMPDHLTVTCGGQCDSAALRQDCSRVAYH